VFTLTPARAHCAGTVRRVASVGVLALAISTLTACSGSPSDPLGFAGCLETTTGTIAVGVANTSGEAVVVEAVELSDASGVIVIDRFIAFDDEARSTAVLFESTGRDGLGGIDLDQAAIEPDAAAYVGIEVQRNGTADGRVGGLVITVDGSERSVPVTLDLRDSCD
jgi:hypothetical protein